MRYAKVIGNLVVNIINSDAPLSTPWIASETAQIGYIYDPETGEFSAPYQLPYRGEIHVKDFVERMPSELPRRLYEKAVTDKRVQLFIDVFINSSSAINLDQPLLISELNYLMTIKDRKGWLLLDSQKTAILA